MKKKYQQQKEYVFVFSRVSTKQQSSDGVSLAMQPQQIEKMLLARGLKPTQFFQEVISGGKTQRPVFEEMREKIASIRKKDKAARIVVAFWDIQRIARNTGVFYAFRNEMKALNVEVLTIDENRNIVDDDNFLSVMVKSLMGEHERNRVIARVKAATEEVARQGYLYFPHAPIGYDKSQAENNRKTLVKNQYAEAIRAVYLDFLNTDEPRTHLLKNKLPHLPKNTANDIFSEFRICLYAGYMPYPKGDRYEDFNLFKGKHEGIITHEECFSIIEKQRSIARKGNSEGFTHYSGCEEHRDIYWAKGILCCSVNGMPFTSATTTKKNKKRFFYYRSPEGYSVPTKLVDELFLSAFSEFRLNDDAFKALKVQVEKKVEESFAKMHAELSVQEKNLKNFQKKKEDLLLVFDRYTPEVLENILNSIKASIVSTENRIREINTNLGAIDNSMLYVLELIQNLGNIFQLADYHKKREMVRAVFGVKPLLDVKSRKIKTTYFNSVISVICCKSESYKTFEIVPSEKNPLGTVKGAYPDDFRTIAAFNPDDLKLLLALVA